MRPVRIHHEYRKEGRTNRGKNFYYVNRNKQASKHVAKIPTIQYVLLIMHRHVQCSIVDCEISAVF